MASSVFGICTIFFHLLMLCMIQGNIAREVPKEGGQNIEAAYSPQGNGVDDHHLCLNNNNHGCNQYPHTHMDHMELSWNILFHIQDLQLGKNINLYFPIKNSSQTPHFIPKQEADSIPFLSSDITKILDFFSFDQDSPQSKAIKQTLNHCELPPLNGETKFCATSLESMLDKLSMLFGDEGSNFRVLTTTQVKNWVPHLQNYTILDDPREISVGKMFGCHPMPYPYAVYYCHGQDSDNRLFMLSLEGEDGLRLDALAICHMDTSQWDPNHASFRVLGIEPGSAPVCHVFPQDNLVWASPPSGYGN
ncbi:hypothetical protein RND81_14G253700 [Saponaria officinalis]|uniref:BURP domain-containing protein n=1 Tax=Saponaria officinalis TaxID=3572 RepID=A0AAW1H0B5_SAPOF